MINIFNQIMLNVNRGIYKYIGSGSCRDVFDLRNGYVVKIARNMAGIAQNRCEYEISNYDKSNLFAKVIQVSKGYRFLIMERALRVSDISDVFYYFNVKDKKELTDLKEIRDIKENYDLLLGDLERKSNWGIIKGRPVIIDYGFTREVMSKYYSYSQE